MAIGWMAVLKSVPWADVVSNAPLVADGARKLWKIAARKPAAPASDAADTAPISAADPVAGFEKKISELEAVGAELQNQMATSSELIKALAEQNAQLVQGIQALRRRASWLTGILAVTAIIAVAALLLVLIR